MRKHLCLAASMILVLVGFALAQAPPVPPPAATPQAAPPQAAPPAAQKAAPQRGPRVGGVPMGQRAPAPTARIPIPAQKNGSVPPLFPYAAAFVAPVTPNASPTAKALLTAIHRLSSRNVLSGQRNHISAPAKHTEQVRQLTGKTPAIWGSDLGFEATGDNDIHARKAMIAEAQRQFAGGALVTLTWQPVRPMDKPAAGRGSVEGKVTDQQWQELITPNSKLNKQWLKQVDKIAAELKKLGGKDVPVIWRPLPEAGSSTFWWSGRSGEKGYTALYQQLFERLAVQKKLSNLIWVWDAAGGSYDGFYPGADYCDVLSASVHGELQESYHDDLGKLAAGKKPIALGSVDAVPTVAVLLKQPLWTWFLISPDSKSGNESLVALYRDLRTLHHGDPALTPVALRAPEPPPCVPVNPNATAEARALLKTICAISGEYTLSGQHNFPNHKSQHSDRFAQLSGKYPYVWGSDFGFTPGTEDKDAIAGRPDLIAEAKKQYAAGSIITLMWHVTRPIDDEPGTWLGSVQNRLTDEQWAELLTPDSPLNKRWQKYMDTAAGYLKQLYDAKIPVIWRPYHENNGNWFWWGYREGDNGFAALYRMTYDRLVNVHHLDNLIWVWNENSPNGSSAGPYANFYPGHRYVDVLATDIYGAFLQPHHDDLLALGNGKPIALGECGRVPPQEIFKTMPRFAWFMVWAGMEMGAGSDPAKATLADPHVLSRGAPLPGRN